MLKYPILYFLTLCFYTINVVAQQDTSDYKLELNDGTRIRMKILAATDDSISFISEYHNNITISRKDILYIKNLTIKKNAPYIDVNDNEKTKKYLYDAISSDGYFSTNAYAVKKGSLVLNNFYLAFNHITYGITNKLSVNGGLFNTLSEDVLHFGAKLKYAWPISEKISLGLSSGLSKNSFSTYSGNEVCISIGNKKKFINIGYVGLIKINGKLERYAPNMISFKINNNFSGKYSFIFESNFSVVDPLQNNNSILGIQVVSKPIAISFGIFSNKYSESNGGEGGILPFLAGKYLIK
jgi:hypothetical protein